MGTSWWKKETTKLIGTQVPKQDSVPKYLGFVRCSLSGTVVKSCPNWHKRLSSSIELGAQHVSPHQKNQSDHTCRKRTWLLPFVVHVMLNFKNSSCSGKNEVSGSSERLHSVRNAFCQRVSRDSRSSENLQKRWITVRPSVAHYLDELFFLNV